MQPSSDAKPEIERNQLLQVRAGLRLLATGGLLILISAGLGLAFRYVQVANYMIMGWAPLILRMIAEYFVVSGLLQVADAPERWNIRELAIFGGLGTLLRPLLWMANMLIPMLHMDWGIPMPMSLLIVLADAAAFATVVYLLDRIETETGGQPRQPLAMAAFGCAGLSALVGLVELLGIVSLPLPLGAVATCALGAVLWVWVKQLSARLATR
ncbi:MAG TPA: hypothetical protein VMZ28_05005 [Kofleriaceae bacterium]|nr:hypothetical protein [Kofleriaceae bacterium]